MTIRVIRVNIILEQNEIIFVLNFYGEKENVIMTVKGIASKIATQVVDLIVDHVLCTT